MKYSIVYKPTKEIVYSSDNYIDISMWFESLDEADQYYYDVVE